MPIATNHMFAYGSKELLSHKKQIQAFCYIIYVYSVSLALCLSTDTGEKEIGNGGNGLMHHVTKYIDWLLESHDFS